MNGEIGMRILMLELADQYDKIFDPATGESGVDAVSYTHLDVYKRQHPLRVRCVLKAP